mmetsp:Transcript_17684/g.70987  ORF Transcript_17684/g.70987 Transcript_17684/m.70987 type:complete len:230 (+) Transcript_17684:782-1471(+)
MRPTRSTPSDAGCRCSPISRRKNGCTRTRSIASARSSPTRASARSSRAPAPTRSARWARRWSSSCTARSRPSSPSKERCSSLERMIISTTTTTTALFFWASFFLPVSPEGRSVCVVMSPTKQLKSPRRRRRLFFLRRVGDSAFFFSTMTPPVSFFYVVASPRTRPSRQPSRRPARTTSSRRSLGRALLVASTSFSCGEQARPLFPPFTSRRLHRRSPVPRRSSSRPFVL